VYRASTSATAADISSLLEHAVHMRPGTHLHHRLLRVLPFLTYANRYPVPTFNSVPHWPILRPQSSKGAE
jgi:hypothetical protein